MAVDKLVDSTQLDSDLTSVANAIRTKGGTSAQLAFPAGFVSAIGNIPTGGGTTTYSLIGSGSFTKTDTGANMNIPVTYNGTPRMVAIEADSEVSGTAMTVLVVNTLDLLINLPTYENSFDNNRVGKSKQKKADNTYVYSVNNTVYLSSSTNLFAGRPSTTYPWIQNVTYNWYIYGEAAT